MRVVLEKTSELGRKLTIQYPWDVVAALEEKELAHAAKHAKIKGFRPGKANPKVVKQEYGDSIRHDVISKLIRQGYVEAIEKEGLSPAGYPDFDAKPVVEGQDFEFSANFEVLPEFEIKELAGTEIEKITAQVTEQDIDATIEKLRQSIKSFEKVERACQEGDNVRMDFEGKVNGEAFKGGQANDFTLELGSKRMIPGFEEAIIGMKPGEVKDIKVTFPDNYHAKDLAGQPSVFTITLKEVQAAKLPELNEDFIKNYGIASGDVQEFRQQLRKELERELKQTLKNKLHDTVFNKLLELNQFELPKALIDLEIESMQEQMKKQMERYGMKNYPVQDKSFFETDARKRVALGLIINKYRQQLKLEADMALVHSLIEERASMFDDNESIKQAMLSNENMLNNVKSEALEQQLVQVLLAQATVKSLEKKFAEIMNQ